VASNEEKDGTGKSGVGCAVVTRGAIADFADPVSDARLHLIDATQALWCGRITAAFLF